MTTKRGQGGTYPVWDWDEIEPIVTRRDPARLHHIQDGLGGDSESVADVDRVPYEEAKRRREVANAEIAEIERAVRAKEVAPIADIERVWTAQVISARARLLSFGSKLPPLLIGKPLPEMKGVIDRAVEEVLGELSEGYDAG